jgi:glycolate oxidase iron-sulfur subunit
LDFVEMENASRCCGAAGVYSVAQSGFSRRLLESKMSSVAGTGADTIATANPGCMIQLETGLRIAGTPGRACHVVDLLDESYRGEG